MTDINQLIALVKACNPQPIQCNVKTCAEMLNLSVPTVKKLIKNKVILLNDAGYVPVTEINKFAYARAEKQG